MQGHLSLPATYNKQHNFFRPPIASRGKRVALPVLSAVNKTPSTAGVDDDSTISGYCSIDAAGKRMAPMTLGEKEQMFVDALSAFYYEGKPSISDEEFDNLKDELMWSGSKVAVLTSDELRFVEATKAYNTGKPVMSDADYDAIKQLLRKAGSIVTAEGPRCSLRSRSMYSDSQVDYLRMTALNVPAAVLVLGIVFGIDYSTGFTITKIVELPGPYGIVAVWGLFLPLVYVLAASITDIIFKDALILKATCPNCGTPQTTYFGDILNVSGNRKSSEVQCGACKSKLTFEAESRQVKCEPPEAAKA